MMTLLRVFQEVGQSGVEAAQHGTEAVRQGAEQAAQGAEPNIGEMLMHHLADGKTMDLPFVGTVELPQWPPLHVAGLTIDLSPTKHVVFLCLAAVIVCLLFLAMARVVTRKGAHTAPSGLANGMEAMILYFRDEVVRRNIGHGADAFTPLILTLFFFILTMNLLGLVPWGATATGNLWVTGTLAAVSFVVIEVSGFLALGPRGYSKTIFYTPKGLGPVASVLMLVIMTPVEILGKLAKPFALAVRLFANMTAGHTVILSLLGLIFLFGHLTLGRWAIAAGSVGMSLAMMFLEIFVALLQAYIFSMLTAVFIGLIRHAH